MADPIIVAIGPIPRPMTNPIVVIDAIAAITEIGVKSVIGTRIAAGAVRGTLIETAEMTLATAAGVVTVVIAEIDEIGMIGMIGAAVAMGPGPGLLPVEMLHPTPPQASPPAGPSSAPPPPPSNPKN